MSSTDNSTEDRGPGARVWAIPHLRDTIVRLACGKSVRPFFVLSLLTMDRGGFECAVRILYRRVYYDMLPFHLNVPPVSISRRKAADRKSRLESYLKAVRYLDLTGCLPSCMHPGGFPALFELLPALCTITCLKLRMERDSVKLDHDSDDRSVNRTTQATISAEYFGVSPVNIPSVECLPSSWQVKVIHRLRLNSVQGISMTASQSTGTQLSLHPTFKLPLTRLDLSVDDIELFTRQMEARHEQGCPEIVFMDLKIVTSHLPSIDDHVRLLGTLKCVQLRYGSTLDFGLFHNPERTLDSLLRRIPWPDLPHLEMLELIVGVAIQPSLAVLPMKRPRPLPWYPASQSTKLEWFRLTIFVNVHDNDQGHLVVGSLPSPWDLADTLARHGSNLRVNVTIDLGAGWIDSPISRDMHDLIRRQYNEHGIFILPAASVRVVYPWIVHARLAEIFGRPLPAYPLVFSPPPSAHSDNDEDEDEERY